MLVRPAVFANEASQRQALPGDVIGGGEAYGALTTAGAGTLTGDLIAGGIVNRTGPGGAYIDTPDTAQNIVTALMGNSPAAQVVPGSTFRLVFRNTVAFAMTFQTGVEGIEYGANVDVAASLVREYLVTIKNATPRVAIEMTTTAAAVAAVFTAVQPMGTVTPGMRVSGTNITAGTKVAGVTLGTSGITGVTLDTVASGSGTQANVFSPCVRFDGFRSSTL